MHLWEFSTGLCIDYRLGWPLWPASLLFINVINLLSYGILYIDTIVDKEAKRPSGREHFKSIVN